MNPQTVLMRGWGMGVLGGRGVTDDVKFVVFFAQCVSPMS